MSILLKLPPEVELKAQAQADAQGVPLERYLQRVIESATEVTDLNTLPLSEQERLLDELATGLGHIPTLPSDAFSRANIYADHD